MTGRPTYAEIDLDALRANFRSSRAFIGEDVGYMGVVKADAYGHGAIECATALQSEGVDWLAVALVEEGLDLRRAGLKSPILCLGSFFAGEEEKLLKHEITPIIFDTGRAEILNAAAKKIGRRVPVHIKIDTGMGRVGMRWDELDTFIEALSTLSNIEVQGLLSHFAAADDLAEIDFTQLQIRRFDEAIEKFAAAGFRPHFLHMANSPGAVARYPTHSNLVRLGGILYGLGGDVLPKGIDRPRLCPAMSVFTSIALIKHVKNGETLGYGRTYRTARDSVIATVPFGYHDGFPRLLSNRGQMIVRGRAVPVVGRVSMDWTIIDVTDVVGASVGDRVTVIGRDSDMEMRAEDLARAADTISYEITCGISSRVPRVFRG